MRFVVGYETRHGVMYFHRRANSETVGMTNSKTFQLRDAKRWKTRAGAEAWRRRHASKASVIEIKGTS